jgi:hypothetical protein
VIKADLKHWGGRRGVEGPYEVDYKRFARQAYERLGDGGVVGIPNARGPDNPLGAEYRFEELYTLAKKSSSITPLGDGRVFHDDEYDIWFVKSQEVNSKFKDEKLTYLAFNVPFGKNFKEWNDEAFYHPDTIHVLNLPSCIEQTKGALPNSPLIDNFSGIIVHSSSAAILKGVNKQAEEFYNQWIKGNLFLYNNLGGEIHKIGAFAVSGGHRTPEEGLLQRIFSPISIASSYTSLPKFEGETLDEFNYWLRISIENSQDTSKLVKGSNKREMLSRHLPRMAQEVLSGRRKGIYNP